MSKSSRRRFLQTGLGVTAGGLILPSFVDPTEASGDLGRYREVVSLQTPPPNPPIDPAVRLRELAIPAAQIPANFRQTEDNILGPYHRANAPLRGKITPPLEPGNVLVIRGRV